MLTTGLLILLLNPLFNERGRHVLFVFLEHRFTLEGFVYGSMSALSIIGIFMLFVSYNRAMAPNKILFFFPNFCHSLPVLLMLMSFVICSINETASEKKRLS